MVDVTFSSSTKHFIPLALFRHIAALAPSELSDEIAYIGEGGVKAIKGPFRDLPNICFGIEMRSMCRDGPGEQWAVKCSASERGGLGCG